MLTSESESDKDDSDYKDGQTNDLRSCNSIRSSINHAVTLRS